MRDGRAMTEDAVISVVSAATRVACRQMTLQHLDALQASLEQASGLPARPDWGRKATAHAELFNVLGGLTGDCDLALLVSSAAGRLHDLVLTVGPAADGIILSSRRRLLRQLRAWDADGAAREMEHHLKACTSWAAWPAELVPPGSPGSARPVRCRVARRPSRRPGSRCRLRS